MMYQFECAKCTGTEETTITDSWFQTEALCRSRAAKELLENGYRKEYISCTAAYIPDGMQIYPGATNVIANGVRYKLTGIRMNASGVSIDAARYDQ